MGIATKRGNVNEFNLNSFSADDDESGNRRGLQRLTRCNSLDGDWGANLSAVEGSCLVIRKETEFCLPDRLELRTDFYLHIGSIYGLLVPPVSGKYYLHIYSDYYSEFRLSSDEDAKNKVVIMRSKGTFIGSSEDSTEIFLERDRRYYFDVRASCTFVVSPVYVKILFYSYDTGLYFI